jgi:protein-tyrosine phosphatase
MHAAEAGTADGGAADPSEVLQEILEIIQQPDPWGMEEGALCEVVDGFLFLSGLDEADNGDALEAAGITAVVNCAPGVVPDRDAEFYARELEYSAVTATLELYAEDEEDYPILEEHLDAYCVFLEAARAQGGVVLTHCIAGINRSAALLVGYMVRVLRWPLLAAVTRTFERRPVVLNNEGFIQQLVDLAAIEGLLAGHDPPRPAPPPLSLAGEYTRLQTADMAEELTSTQAQIDALRAELGL